MAYNRGMLIRGVGDGERALAMWRALDSVSKAESVDDALLRGMEAVGLILGPGVAGLAFFSRGTELISAAALGKGGAVPWQTGMPQPSRALDPSLVEDAPHLYDSPDSVRAALDSLPTHARRLLTVACGAEPGSLARSSFACCRDGHGFLVLTRLPGQPALDVSAFPVIAIAADLVAAAIDRLTVGAALEEAGRLKTEVISTLSHHMRTPLASIKGCATALLLQGRDYSEETRQEFLHVIDEESDRLSALVEELLASATIEAGLLSIERQPVLLPRLVESVAHEMASRSSKHRFVATCPRPFPLIHADPGRIEQVLRNLLDNAVKYSPNGGLVSVSGRYDDGEATVSVADQGIGIGPEHLNRLFERFYRVKGDLGVTVPGTGLGLPIARAIVEAHGGRIWAESTLGQGSIFRFTLPLRFGQETDDDE